MSCENVAQLHAYHDRQLGPAAREAFETHLAECQDCAALLADLRTISRKVVKAPMPVVPLEVNRRLYAAWDVSRQRGVLRIASWLSGAAAAVLVGGLLLTPRGNTST